MKNSNSCIDSIESKPTELTLVKSSSLPVIPSVHFVVTKGDEKEEFKTFKELENWFIDECDRDICDEYHAADFDDKGGCDGPYDWVRQTFDFNMIQHFLEQGAGWKLERVSV